MSFATENYFGRRVACPSCSVTFLSNGYQMLCRSCAKKALETKVLSETADKEVVSNAICISEGESMEKIKNPIDNLGLKYYINNPSAWDSYSQNVSDAIRCAVDHYDNEQKEVRDLRKLEKLLRNWYKTIEDEAQESKIVHKMFETLMKLQDRRISCQVKKTKTRR